MDNSQSFKQYLADSKKQLEKVLEKAPVNREQYDVSNYCRLIVGESLDNKQTINLKPGHLFTILWEYANADNPTPKKIKFLNVENLDKAVEFDLYWSKSQLTQWLCKNTKT